MKILIFIVLSATISYGQLKVCEKGSDSKLNIELQSEKKYLNYEMEKYTIENTDIVVRRKTGKSTPKNIKLDEFDLFWYERLKNQMKGNKTLCARKDKYFTDEK